jgi:hypothetical protein
MIADEVVDEVDVEVGTIRADAVLPTLPELWVSWCGSRSQSVFLILLSRDNLK